jgi:hypothetical protein
MVGSAGMRILLLLFHARRRTTGGKRARSLGQLAMPCTYESLASVKKVQAMEMIHDCFISKPWQFHLQRSSQGDLGQFWTCFEINKIQKVHNFFLRNFWIFFFKISQKICL